jgi:hypothetical protein
VALISSLLRRAAQDEDAAVELAESSAVKPLRVTVREDQASTASAPRTAKPEVNHITIPVRRASQSLCNNRLGSLEFGLRKDFIENPRDHREGAESCVRDSDRPAL